jgi:malonyl-CoA/methylmalonyl-CoA synthetase
MDSKFHPASTAGTERTALVPPHARFNIFPNSPLFSVLLRHAHRDRVAIRDVRLGLEKRYAGLLADVLNLRFSIETALNQQIIRRIEEGEEVFIGVLAAGGYEFAVGIIAVLALGAAAVPMGEFVQYLVNNQSVGRCA